MRSRWNLPIWVLYAGFCLLVLGFIVRGLEFGVPWSHPYQVTADFSDAGSILANNEVFMNGTKVGYVKAVSVSGGQAKVQMILDNRNGVPLHPDATAQVRKKNLLGETYIDPATVQRVQLLINALGEGTTNNGDRMNSSASSLNTLVTVLNGPAVELSARKQQVTDIVLELQKFYDVLAKQREQVRQEFGTWAAVMGQLAAQEQSIGGTVQQADTLLQNLDVLVTGEGGNLRATLTELPGTLTQLNSFLTQSTGILGNLSHYRTAIHDVFPHLGSSFADTDPANNNQHFWSVFSVNCPSNCTSTAEQTTPNSSAPNASWAAAMGG
jgi:ABC-type transporter Mla subunit MlaD